MGLARGGANLPVSECSRSPMESSGPKVLRLLATAQRTHGAQVSLVPSQGR